MEKKEKKTWNPNPYVLLLIIILICSVATWIVPAGSFERVYDEELGRNLVVPGSFEYIEDTPVGITGFLESVFNGFVTLLISSFSFSLRPLTSTCFPAKAH